jgi:hypothetical protein
VEPQWTGKTCSGTHALEPTGVRKLPKYVPLIVLLRGASGSQSGAWLGYEPEAKLYEKSPSVCQPDTGPDLDAVEAQKLTTSRCVEIPRDCVHGKAVLGKWLSQAWLPLSSSWLKEWPNTPGPYKCVEEHDRLHTGRFLLTMQTSIPLIERQSACSHDANSVAGVKENARFSSSNVARLGKNVLMMAVSCASAKPHGLLYYRLLVAALTGLSFWWQRQPLGEGQGGHWRSYSTRQSS